MRDWLLKALFPPQQLPGDVEEYLLGRGVRESRIRDIGLGVWEPPTEPAPDGMFRKRYGRHGEFLRGRLTVPFYSPRGKVIGFEARDMKRKAISRHLLPESMWNPVWIGLTQQVMEKIWRGASIWIGEGLFDMAALEHIIPESDVSLASVRAKLTRKHVEFLRRFCLGIVHMVYDEDEAGRSGVVGKADEDGNRRWGALESLRRVGIECRDVRYRGGKDPGEIWQKKGTQGLRRAFGVFV